MSTLRERIVDVASDLFQARGINSTGVDTIVAEAGIAKMTLYKYFRSKEELILEVLNQRQAEFRRWLNERLGADGVPAERMMHLFDLIDEWVSAPDFRGMPFLKASSEFPDEASSVHRLSAEHSEQFRQYLATLAREAGVREAEPLALQLSLLIEGAMLAEQMSRGCGAAKHAKQAARVLFEAALRN